MDNKYETASTNYAVSPIKLLMPSVTHRSQILTFSAVLMHVNVSEKCDVLVCNCEMHDKYGRTVKSAPEHVYLSASSSSGKISLVFDLASQNVSLHDALLVMEILTKNSENIRIEFEIKDTKTIRLRQVLVGKMSDKDKELFACAVKETDTDTGETFTGESEDASKDNYAAFSPSLSQYINAIFREMYFLRDEGGRKYKVTKGRFIAKNNDAYSYSFELESELYISDDAPITLAVGLAVASGVVMLSDGFQLIVLLDRDLGAAVGSGYISVEPWKLLQKLNERLLALDARHRIAFKLLEEGPAQATKAPYAEIVRGQSAAIERGFTEDITVIWGPPGTGKTYTMATLAGKFLQSGKTVLIVSHSNISVDNVIGQIARQMTDSGDTEMLREGRILRYGYVRDDELAKNEYVVSFNRALSKVPRLYAEYEAFSKKSEQLKMEIKLAPSQAKLNEQLQLERRMKAIRARVKETEKALVLDADLVATTISKVYADPVFEDHRYDVVMFDEVSMAYVPQIICAASYAEKHFICVGDFRQLSPIVQSDAKKLLDKDIFTFLGISDGYSDIHPHPWLVMLDEQRRMHPDISAFPNYRVYKRLLRDHESVFVKWNRIIENTPFPKSAMNLVDLSGTYCTAGKSSDNSRFNIVSALISFATALEAESGRSDSENDGGYHVGIITPYSAQTLLMRAFMYDAFEKQERPTVSCATVHQFQGSERNVIIFDAVESYPSSQAGWLMSKNENNSVTRLINVAVTRTRSKFVVVANKRFWLSKFDGTHNLFYLLVKHMDQSSNLIDMKNQALASYLHSLDYGKNIKLFADFYDSFSDFQKDVQNAKKQIAVSLPDGELIAPNADTVLRVLETKKASDVKLIMKAKNFAAIPGGWKAHCWQSEDAVFPLVAIDDKVIWYGLPPVKGRFTEGNRSFLTVCPLYFRITGSRTVEMIKSLTNLENRTVDGRQGPMQPKYGRVDTETDDGKGDVGLARYISEHERCRECGKAMKQTRGRSGKPYLRCDSGHIAYLAADTVNRYIAYNAVTCPKCQSDLYAKVGSSLYIRCRNGHYVKPEEI